MRHKCEIRNKPFMYDGRCSKLSKEKIKENLDKGMPYVIRQKMPKIGGKVEQFLNLAIK